MATVPCKLVGEDGNIFAVLGRATRALKAADRAEDAKVMVNRATNARSYSSALGIIMEYVHDSQEDEE